MRHIKIYVLTCIMIITGFTTGIFYSCKSKSDVISTSGEKPLQEYTARNSYDEMVTASDNIYFEPVRISPVGTKKKPL